jgi:hypothetical protein
VFIGVVGGCKLRKAEIENLRDSARSKKNVGWRDIAMDDVLAMSRGMPNRRFPINDGKSAT